jgi:ribosomal protein S6
MRERDAEVTNLDIMFYLDIDRNDEAFKSWIEKADNYLEEKDAVVVDIDTEE